MKEVVLYGIGLGDGEYQDDYFFQYEEEEDSGSEYIVDDDIDYEEAFEEEVVELSDGDLGSESEYEEEIIEDGNDDKEYEYEYEYEEDFGEEDFEEVSFEDSSDGSDFVSQKNVVLDKSHHLVLREADSVSYDLTLDDGDFDDSYIFDPYEFEENKIESNEDLMETTQMVAPRGSKREKMLSHGSEAMKKKAKRDLVAAVSSKNNDPQKIIRQGGERQAKPDESKKGMDMATLLAAKANDRQKRMSQGQQKVTEVKPRPVQNVNMAAMIAAKASDRRKRLDEGGERQITPVKPKPNQGMDIAAMVASKANQRNNRLAKGGERKITPVEPKPNQGMDIASMVASKANQRNKRLRQAQRHSVNEVKPKTDKSTDMAAIIAAKAREREKKRTQGEQLQIPQPKPKPKPSDRPDLAAMIAAKAKDRQRRMEQGEQNIKKIADKPTVVTSEASDRRKRMSQGQQKLTESKPRPIQSVNLAAMIAAKANDRQKRLETGERKMTSVKPKPKPKPKPNKAMDIAAMVAAKANARNQRIEAGGKVKVRKVRKENKTAFVNIANEAARVGSRSKSDEHTVEAAAELNAAEEWEGPTGLRTDHIRSDMFMVVHEAAALGAMRKLKPAIVTNYDEHAHVQEEEPEDIDKMRDEHGRRVVRQKYLIDQQVAEEKKNKRENWSAENVAKIVQYKNWEDVILPAERAPRLGRKEAEKTRADLVEAIANGVAERAWERSDRLARPKQDLRITQKCMCKFCVNPSPFQTHKFRQLEKGEPLICGPIEVAQKVPKKKKRKSKRMSKRRSDTENPASDHQDKGKLQEQKNLKRRRKPESIFIPTIEPSQNARSTQARSLKSDPPILLLSRGPSRRGPSRRGPSRRGLSRYEYRYEYPDEKMPALDHSSVSAPDAPLLYSPPQMVADTTSSTERQIYSGYKGEPGVLVLLDETTTWSYKRKVTKRPKGGGFKRRGRR